MGKGIIYLTENGLNNDANMILAELCGMAYKHSYSAENGFLVGGIEIYNMSLKELFNKKKIRVNGNTEEYIKALKRNVLYFTKMGDTLNYLICNCLITKNIPDISQCSSEFQAMQRTLRVTDEMLIKDKRTEIYDNKYKNNIDKINALEYDYAFLDIYTSIIYYLYLYICGNKQILNPLYSADSTYLSQSIDKICYEYTKLYLAGELL